jgi:hypothetical protein
MHFLGVFEAILRAGEYTWLVGEEEEKKSGFLASSQVQFREFNQLTVFQALGWEGFVLCNPLLLEDFLSGRD